MFCVGKLGWFVVGLGFWYGMYDGGIYGVFGWCYWCCFCFGWLLDYFDGEWLYNLCMELDRFMVVCFVCVFGGGFDIDCDKC